MKSTLSNPVIDLIINHTKLALVDDGRNHPSVEFSNSLGCLHCCRTTARVIWGDDARISKRYPCSCFQHCRIDDGRNVFMGVHESILEDAVPPIF